MNILQLCTIYLFRDFNSAKALKNVISDGGETNLISNYIPRADEEVFKKINFTVSIIVYYYAA